jgi:hypothetical protein
MVLGYISLHIFPAESQHIDNCVTSAEAYQLLQRQHEQRGGLKQIQLIHQLMQVRFDCSPNSCDTIMTHVCDLVYRIEQRGEIDVAKLACLFVVHGLQSTHPSVHEALSPAIMEGTLTFDMLEQKLNYHYEFEATNNPNLLTFPSLSPILPQTPLSSMQSLPSSPTVALPASFPPRANICPNCKHMGHGMEHCIAPGGKMEGCTAAKAVTCQQAVGNMLRIRTAPSNPPSDSPIQLERDGTIAIRGTRYHLTRQPAPEPTTASIAEVEVESDMTAANQGEYSDWVFSNSNPAWGYQDGTLDTASCLLATIDTMRAADTALIAHRDHDPPFVP